MNYRKLLSLICINLFFTNNFLVASEWKDLVKKGKKHWLNMCEVFETSSEESVESNASERNLKTKLTKKSLETAKDKEQIKKSFENLKPKFSIDRKESRSFSISSQSDEELYNYEDEVEVIVFNRNQHRLVSDQRIPRLARDVENRRDICDRLIVRFIVVLGVVGNLVMSAFETD